MVSHCSPITDERLFCSPGTAVTRGPYTCQGAFLLWNPTVIINNDVLASFNLLISPTLKSSENLFTENNPNQFSRNKTWQIKPKTPIRFSITTTEKMNCIIPRSPTWHNFPFLRNNQSQNSHWGHLWKSVQSSVFIQNTNQKFL